ncbi:MAG: TetR/AcrR family transcriptional regulator [Chloroflexota bacterium]
MRRTKEEARQTRENILKAAATIIARSGIGAFTIEAVAQEAGVTKGGVLHHFPSREALLNGLIDHVIEAFNIRLQKELSTEPAGQPGRWLRAYIRAVFSVQYDVQYLIPALAAAVAADHRLLERIRRRFEESQQAVVRDGIDPVQATIVRLAVDGIVFARSLNVDVLDEETSRKVYNELFSLTSSTRISP